MTNYLSKNLNTLFLNCALAFISIANAQEVRVIDNKGTITKINKVTTSATVPADNVIGDVWFDSSAPSKVSKIYNGTVWLIIDEDKVTTFSQETATPTGVITYINEAGASLTANTVSADTNNKIMAGTDGGAFLLDLPVIIAAGKVRPNGIAFKIFGARVNNVSEGVYQVTFLPNALDNANYIIQLTIISAFGNGNDDPDLSYYDQQTTGFRVETGNNDNGDSDRDEQDFQFMFTVIDF